MPAMQQNGLDVSTLYLQENVDNKVILDPVGHHQNVRCCSDGRIALMSKTTVHVFTPQFRPMQFFSVSWITLHAKVFSSPPELPKNARLSQRLQLGTHNEVRLVFKSVAWMPSVLRDGDSHSLAVLLSDGSFLLLRRGLRRESRHTLRNVLEDELGVCEHDVLFDFDRDLRDEALRHEHRVQVFLCAEKSCGERGAALFTASERSVIAWAANATADDARVSLSPLQRFAFEDIRASYVLTFSPTIASLSLVGSDGDADTLCVCFRHGAVSLLRCDAHSSAFAELRRVELRYRVIYSVVCTGDVLLLRCERAVVALALDSLSLLWEKDAHHQRVTDIFAHDDADEAARVCFSSSSLDGSLRSWCADTHSVSRTHSELLSAGGVSGMSVDPLRLVLALSLCNQKLTDNSRELQLNYSLATEQTRFCLAASPRLAPDWLLSPVGAAAVFLQVARELVCDARRSLSLVGVAAQQSVDRSRRRFRVQPMPPLPPAIRAAQLAVEQGEEFAKKKSRQSKGGADDDSESCSDFSVEEDEDEDEEKSRKQSKAARVKDKEKEKALNGEHVITTLHKQLRENLDPDPLLRGRIALDALALSLSLAGACVRETALTRGAETDVLTNAMDSLSPEELRGKFLHVDSDFSTLHTKIALWQLCSAAMRSIIVLRCFALPPEAAELQKHRELLADIRRSSILGRALIACHRLVTNFDAGLVQQGDLFTVAAWLSIAESLQTAEADALVADIRGLLPALREHSLTECCPVCDEELCFDPQSPESAQCPACLVSTDRCALSLCLVTSHNAQLELYSCSLCSAAINYSRMTQSRGLMERLHGPCLLLCAHCRLLMCKLSQ